MKNYMKVFFGIIALFLAIDIFDILNLLNHPETYPFGENDFGLFNSNKISYNSIENYFMTIGVLILLEIITLFVILKNHFERKKIYYLLGGLILIVRIII